MLNIEDRSGMELPDLSSSKKGGIIDLGSPCSTMSKNFCNVFWIRICSSSSDHDEIILFRRVYRCIWLCSIPHSEVIILSISPGEDVNLELELR